MDKHKLLDWISAQPQVHRLTCRQILDAFVRTERSGTSACTLFLSPAEQQLAESVRAHFPAVLAEWFPEEAERKVLCLSSEWGATAIPDISVLRIEGSRDLSHRDVLGAVLGTGIMRDRTGDIRTDGTRAELMVKSQVAEFLTDQLRAVGSSPVRCESTPHTAFTLKESPGEILRIIVPSARLDAVVAALTRRARGKAQEQIRRGEVKVNHTVSPDPKCTVAPQDVLSIRGHGRYRVQSEEGTTKKGNLVLTVTHKES